MLIIPVKKLAYLVKDFMEIIKNQSNFDPSFLDIQGMVNTSFNEYEYYKKIGLLRSNTETEILVLNIMFGFNDIYLS